MQEMLSVEDWPVIEVNGQRWAVAPRYIGGVGIGEALALAQSQGCTLPNRELVDKIWALADCKLDALKFVRKHDGTARTMASAEVMQSQDAKVLDAIEAWEQATGMHATLVAGTHKDVILEGKRLGLYGWQKKTGAVIQPPFYGHSAAWKDYSQGARLVRLLQS